MCRIKERPVKALFHTSNLLDAQSAISSYRACDENTHTKVQEERHVIAAGAERGNAEVTQDVVLVLLYPKVGDLDVSLAEERTLVLARIPQRL